MKRLARLRVPLGFLFGVVVMVIAAPTRRSLLVGGLVALIGERIRVWAAGHLDKGREVTSSGPYAFTRHPLYLGSTLIGIGLVIACADLIVAVIVLSYLALTLTAAIRTEEAHLTEKFGAAYPAYRAGTMSVPRPFSLQRVVYNREYRALVGVVFVLGLLWWKATI